MGNYFNEFIYIINNITTLYSIINIILYLIIIIKYKKFLYNIDSSIFTKIFKEIMKCYAFVTFIYMLIQIIIILVLILILCMEDITIYIKKLYLITLISQIVFYLINFVKLYILDKIDIYL